MQKLTKTISQYHLATLQCDSCSEEVNVQWLENKIAKITKFTLKELKPNGPQVNIANLVDNLHQALTNFCDEVDCKLKKLIEQKGYSHFRETIELLAVIQKDLAEYSDIGAKEIIWSKELFNGLQESPTYFLSWLIHRQEISKIYKSVNILILDAFGDSHAFYNFVVSKETQDNCPAIKLIGCVAIPPDKKIEIIDSVKTQAERLLNKRIMIKGSTKYVYRVLRKLYLNTERRGLNARPTVSCLELLNFYSLSPVETYNALSQAWKVNEVKFKHVPRVSAKNLSLVQKKLILLEALKVLFEIRSPGQPFEMPLLNNVDEGHALLSKTYSRGLYQEKIKCKSGGIY